MRGHNYWARGPDNAGSYNSHWHETGFFCDGGDYDGFYGRFFLNWYSQVLVNHGDLTLSLAKSAFEGTCIAVKLPAEMLHKNGSALNFACAELQLEELQEALADPHGLAWQVLNAAWDACIVVASENAFHCHVELTPLLMERDNFAEFERFVQRMHGRWDRNQQIWLLHCKRNLCREVIIPRYFGVKGPGLEWKIMATDLQNLIGANEDDDEEEIDMDVKGEDNEDQFQTQQQLQEQVSTPGGGARRSRPLEEKERTKLRERHRRAITARILAGLRRHGNYNLRVRADINDVIAALAREAGWVVLPDGTTFPSRSQGSRPAGGTSAGMTSSPSQIPSQQAPPTSLQGVSSGYCTSVEYNACHMKGVFLPTPPPYDLSSSAHSQSSDMAGNGGERSESLPLIAGSMEAINDKQLIGLPPKLPERDFAGTPYVPVCVMLPLGVINMKCELVDPDSLLKQLRVLKSINVDGVMTDCWWGIVEAHAPQEYNWNGYRRLFQMVHELKLKLQVVMSFHECGGNVGDDVCIPLPHWVAEIGRSNPDIFFTDREGRRNTECLSWGIDKERVLRGRTAVEVLVFDIAFNTIVATNKVISICYFLKFTFEGYWISSDEVGLGPCGELRYPSCPVKHGWRYPGIGEFQVLVNHGDLVLSLAKSAFEGTCIAVKLPGIHWLYKTSSHAAELTAGFYNPCNRDGYVAIAEMLHKHGAALNFACAELQREELQEALADPHGLAWQVLNAAWDSCIVVASENAFHCHDRVGYNKILHTVKPVNDPEGRHFSSFTYLRLTPLLMERDNFAEFERFVKRMHVKDKIEQHDGMGETDRLLLLQGKQF
ncbi:Beta-amylase 7 [Hibiscus syriacus]|uniref:Beta-amylase n=1 Tax=Hibiscus syriacus TaxID=106335 RepID=A0A6A3CBS7_HIBSY|nr:Beta-amylase 7 [Hibiscus syriacus]